MPPASAKKLPSREGGSGNVERSRITAAHRSAVRSSAGSALEGATVPAGSLRITAATSGQAHHLVTALKGHCDVDLEWNGSTAARIVTGDATANRSAIRRVDRWLSEFNVASVGVEFDGKVYTLSRTSD